MTPLSGYRKMRRALAKSVLSRPEGLVQRLTYPIAREAFRLGYAHGYVEGHMDGQESRQKRETLAYVDKALDNVADLSPDLSWRNVEVIEMLEDVRSLLLTGEATHGSFTDHQNGDQA